MKRTTLALLVSWLCACASGASETTTQTVDSAYASRAADSAAAAAAAATAAAPPVVAPVSYSDTAVPRSYVDTAAWADARQIDTTESAPAFQCAPRMFTEADTLTLRMIAPHGNWLSVKRPDETTFYLVAPASGTAPNYSVVPADSFPDKVQLRFLGRILSKPGLDASNAMTAIFGQPGYYEFRVGNDLATNRPRDVEECVIRLVPRSRY